MKRVFGDFESNGLYRKEKVIETSSGVRRIPGFTPSPESFSYIVTDGETLDIREAGTLYFYNPEIIEHKAEAEAIHGMTREFLSQYKDDFTGNVRKLHRLFYRGNMVGHNFRGFDVNVGRDFLSKMGYDSNLPINRIEDTMFDSSRYFARVFSEREGRQINMKKLKLVDLCKELKINDNLIRKIHKKAFGYEPEQSWHSSSWDTTATYLCYRIGKSKGIFS